MDEGVLPDVIQRDFPCYGNGCGETFRSRKDCEIHYNAKHRHVCSVCKKTFYSQHLLELHVQETHDTFFAVMSQKKPMYECFVETCKVKFNGEDERFTHCIEQHKDKRPFYFPRSKSLNQPPTTIKTQPSSTNTSASTPTESDVPVDFDDSDIHVADGLPAPALETSHKKTSKSGTGGKNNMHISFGHKAVKFIPRQTFAMAKKKPSISQTQNSSNEEKMDLSEMQDALSEFSSNPMKSCAAGVINLPDKEKMMIVDPEYFESLQKVSDSLLPKSVETDANAIASENAEKRKWEQQDGEKICDTKKLKLN